jgi:hypothetical protein
MPFIKASDKPIETPQNQPTQELLPAQGQTGRDEKGRFVDGHGFSRGGLPKNWQYFPERASYLLQKYTVGEIKRIVTTADEFDALPGQDGQIMMRIAKTFTSKGDSAYWNMLDRMEGYKKQEQGVGVGNVQGNLTIQQVFVGELPRGIVET